MSSQGRSRVAVANVADGGVLYWLFKLYLFAGLVLVAVLIAAAGALYAHFARQVPPIPDLSTYAMTAPGITTVLAQDGTVIGEFANKWREVVPLDEVPPRLIDAFVATEDRRFFTHGGLDWRGMTRAFVANWRRSGLAQGGSTITQQVGKAFLGSERSFSRKIKEAIFARRLEARYGKREILALYLNHVFLGNGAYGVKAAAHRYFGKELAALDLAEMALIAGLANAPSHDNPLVHPEAALHRRAVVLDDMVEAGQLGAAEAARWKAAPLQLVSARDRFHTMTPYFTEHVRRELVRKYGERDFYEKGWRVETTVLPFVDDAAAENVDAAVRKLDKRQGWRGPEARLHDAEARTFVARATQLYGDGPLVEGKLYLGLVDKLLDDRAVVRVGARSYPLPIANMAWAAPFSLSDSNNDKLIEQPSQALRKNDVVWVRWAWRAHTPRFSEFAYNDEGESTWLPEQTHKPPKVVELTLEQTPRPSAAVYTFDHANGYTLAMVGGDDFDGSELNRVTQSCRQPGSAYKPVYYSLALDRGYDFKTLWNDRPKAEVDPDTGQLYLPQNIDGSYNVQVDLERALVWSKNPPSVEIFHILAPKGARDVAAWAERLGIASKLIRAPRAGERDCGKEYCPALALGSSCVFIDEITRAFAVFARNGRPIAPVTIRRVVDRAGRVVEDHTTFDDPWLHPADRLDRLAATAGVEAAPVIAPRTAWLTSKLLREVVSLGHSQPIRAAKVLSAGKTGTSSHTWDVWFIGYTSRWMSTVWIGDDEHERQLGTKDASFMLTVPMWARYMYRVTDGQPLDEIPWERPPGVKDKDIGGPLDERWPPPPEPGFDLEGKPLAPPTKINGQSVNLGPAPPTTVRQKTVRVPSAIPTAPAPPTPPPSR